MIADLNAESSLAERLSKLRQFHAPGVTMADYARKLGYAPSVYENWEKGHTEPNVAAFRALVEETGVSLNWLILGEGPMFDAIDAGT